MLALRQLMQRPVRIVLFLLVVYAFCWVKGWPQYYDDEELPPSKRPHSRTLGPHEVKHEQFIVSVTTTAVDAYAKVSPLLLFTPVQDHGQLLLFSDLQMEIGKWPIFDVLWRYSQEFIRSAPELGRYRAQVDYARKSLPMSKLRKQDEEEEKEILLMLDKYKILQTMAAAWEYRPDRAWYAFVGDETYINRANLLEWLSQYDSRSKHFFGNPPTLEFPDPFSAAGDSIIVSRQVMKELFADRKDLIKTWQNKVIDYSSAFDLIFNVLQTELKVGLEGVWPGISGFNPSSAPFSPALWCEPILMMHHVSADTASDIWKLEKDRVQEHLASAPLRFADLWDLFMRPENLNFTRNDWDNLSSDPSNARWNILFEGDHPDGGKAKNGEDSEEACEQSCIKSEYCMQWSYSSVPQKNWNENPPTKCHLSSSVRFGRHVDRKEVNDGGDTATLTWQSGWKKARFVAWASQQRCQAQHQR
ncbi:hypothetical protein ACN47E_009888 [Coniothyrium glycines]